MSIDNEIESVSDFIKSIYSTSNVEKQTVPPKPTVNTFVVRLLSDHRSVETLYNTLIERDYQIVYFGINVQDTLTKMDNLSRQTMDGKFVIPIKDSLRYIRVEGFNFSQPFKTESNIDACIGVLQTQVREARTQEQYQKIMHVYQRTVIRVSLD